MLQQRCLIVTVTMQKKNQTSVISLKVSVEMIHIKSYVAQSLGEKLSNCQETGTGIFLLPQSWFLVTFQKPQKITQTKDSWRS